MMGNKIRGIRSYCPFFYDDLFFDLPDCFIPILKQKGQRNMEIMYQRKSGKKLEVYNYFSDSRHTWAICFDPEFASRNNGQGWVRVKLTELVPEQHVNMATKQFMSKTERNRIKSQLKLCAAIWECTDGERFENHRLDEAIEHQRELMSNNSAE